MEKFCSGWSVEARRVILSQPYGDWRVERVNYWSSVPELMQAPYRAFSSKNQGPKVICSRNFDLAKNRHPPTLFSHVSSLCHHHRSPEKYQVQNNGNGGVPARLFDRHVWTEEDGMHWSWVASTLPPGLPLSTNPAAAAHPIGEAQPLPRPKRPERHESIFHHNIWPHLMRRLL